MLALPSIPTETTNRGTTNVHLTGELLIGGESRKGTNGEIKGVNPATGETLEAKS